MNIKIILCFGFKYYINTFIDWFNETIISKQNRVNNKLNGNN